jgi:hypothetical protein
MPDDRPDGRKIGGGRQERPDEVRDAVGQQRQDRCDRQKRGRVEPGIVAAKSESGRQVLDRLVRACVVGGLGLAVEHQLAGAPYADEVARRAIGCMPRGEEENGIGDAERDARELEPVGRENVAAAARERDFARRHEAAPLWRAHVTGMPLHEGLSESVGFERKGEGGRGS